MPPHKSSTLCDGIWLSEIESLEWEIGIRFNPTDQALGRILVYMVFGGPDNIVLPCFRYINIYEREPWSLSSEFAHEGKSYFFTRRRKKSEKGKGKNIDRTVSGYGFWQKTGSDSTIEIRDNNIEKLVRITKTSLKFHTPKGKGTPWLMKEYVLESDKSNENLVKSDDLGPLVLCVIYSNDDGKQNPSYQRGTRSEFFNEGSEMQSSIFQQIGDPGVSPASFRNNLHYLAPDFTGCQSQPDPCPKSNSIV